jgi:hypothetical protein
VEYKGHNNRYTRCSITIGVIGGFRSPGAATALDPHPAARCRSGDRYPGGTPPIHSLNRQQLRPIAGMALLATALATTAFAPHRWLKPRTIAGGWFGGIARAAIDPLLQARQLCCYGGEQGAEICILLSQSQDKLSGIGRPRQQIRLVDARSRTPISCLLYLNCIHKSIHCQ